jgi:hypothetical protein
MFPFGRWLACYFSWWEGFLAGSFSTFGKDENLTCRIKYLVCLLPSFPDFILMLFLYAFL